MYLNRRRAERYGDEIIVERPWTRDEKVPPSEAGHSRRRPLFAGRRESGALQSQDTDR
jgi:hypothetical protein